jgi:hypothetical protein
MKLAKMTRGSGAPARGSKRPLFRQPISLPDARHASAQPRVGHKCEHGGGVQEAAAGKRVLVCRQHMAAFSKGALTLDDTIHASAAAP